MKNVLEWLEERKINDESKVAYRGPNEKITFGQVIRNSRKIGTVLSNVKGTAPIAIMQLYMHIWELCIVVMPTHPLMVVCQDIELI